MTTIKTNNDRVKFAIEQLYWYNDLNTNMGKSRFWNNLDGISSSPMDTIPLFLGQMGLIYNIIPEQYTGMINESALNFFANNFRRNVIFLLSPQAYLLNILIMRATIDDKININTFFANNIKSLYHYQYYKNDYGSVIDEYKLADAYINLDNYEDTEEIALIFF